MTQEQEGRKIESVAIIGGGPGGLAALHELLNVSSDGSTLVNKKKSSETPRFFKNIVLFERASDIGGSWRFTQSPGTSFSQFLSLSNVNDLSYNRPNVLFTSPEVPPNVEEFSYESPLFHESIKDGVFPPPLEYYDTALYNELYTNTPDVLMRFSFQPRTPAVNEPWSPFINHSQVKAKLDAVAKLPGIERHIRYNSSVQRVRKVDGKWHVTVREGTNKWYLQKFDAVVIASGRQYYPYWPQIDGLLDVKNFISHSKNYRSADNFTDKDILIVGCSVSAVDIIKRIYKSARSVSLVVQKKKDPKSSWLTRAINIPEISRHTSIKHLSLKNTRVLVEFIDGSKKDYDHILFATGYHTYYPFMDQQLFTNTEKINPKDDFQRERVKNFYLHTFHNQDPTLAHLGLIKPNLFFHALETQSIGVAGVFSNIRILDASIVKCPLPSYEDQVEWERKREDKIGSNKFEDYEHATLNDILGKKLVSLGPRGRLNPLVIDNDIGKAYDKGLTVLEELFYQAVKK